MSKYCPMCDEYTNCTENCTHCVGAEKRYSVKAYLETRFVGLMEELETDGWSEVEAFIWENCQQGLNCKILDRRTGDESEAFADRFNENTIDIEELIDGMKGATQ